MDYIALSFHSIAECACSASGLNHFVHFLSKWQRNVNTFCAPVEQSSVIFARLCHTRWQHCSITSLYFSFTGRCDDSPPVHNKPSSLGAHIGYHKPNRCERCHYRGWSTWPGPSERRLVWSYRLCFARSGILHRVRMWVKKNFHFHFDFLKILNTVSVQYSMHDGIWWESNHLPNCPFTNCNNVPKLSIPVGSLYKKRNQVLFNTTKMFRAGSLSLFAPASLQYAHFVSEVSPNEQSTIVMNSPQSFSKQEGKF